MSSLVLYHSADYDGIASGLICEKFLKLRGNTVKLEGWDYGKPVPKVDSLVDEIYMVDITIPELMDDPRLIWIDHHKTSIAEYNERARGYRIDGVAACRLCWQWFTCENDLPKKEDYVDRKVEEPITVRLLGEYDVWDHRDEHTQPLQLGLRTYKEFPTGLLNMAEYKLFTEVLNRGELVFDYERSIRRSYVKKMFELNFEGIKFLALNAAQGNSLSFSEHKELEKYDALFFFRYNGEARNWMISLYSNTKCPKDIDLSVIAKKYGGGGHKGACGFTVADINLIIAPPLTEYVQAESPLYDRIDEVKESLWDVSQRKALEQYYTSNSGLLVGQVVKPPKSCKAMIIIGVSPKNEVLLQNGTVIDRVSLEEFLKFDLVFRKGQQWVPLSKLWTDNNLSAK